MLTWGSALLKNQVRTLSFSTSDMNDTSVDDSMLIGQFKRARNNLIKTRLANDDLVNFSVKLADENEDS